MAADAMNDDAKARAALLLHNEVLQQLVAIHWCVTDLESHVTEAHDQRHAHARRLIAQAAKAAMASTRQAIEELGWAPDDPKV
jgi:signal transduction histidine kinase